MSYIARERSAQDGDPVFRCQFSLRGELYRRTTERAIVLDSDGSWVPAPIEFGDFNQTGELSKDPLQISLPRDDEFALLFLGGVPEQVTTLTVFKGHQGDVSEEFVVYWKGRVVASDLRDDQLVLECENIFSSIKRPGLRARYQKNCRHALYSRGCNLNDYDFATIATATDVVGKVVIVPDADSSDSPDGYFTGGVLEMGNGDKCYITKHEGQEITLLTLSSSLAEEIDESGSSNITLYPGCDHSRSTCQTKFDNLNNFGGFPWIPGKNPFGNDVTGSIA